MPSGYGVGSFSSRPQKAQHLCVCIPVITRKRYSKLPLSLDSHSIQSHYTSLDAKVFFYVSQRLAGTWTSATAGVDCAQVLHGRPQSAGLAAGCICARGDLPAARRPDSHRGSNHRTRRTHVRDVFSNSVAVVMTILAVAIALLGPGAFSVDARLFGRREILIHTDRSAYKDSSNVSSR